MNERPLDVCVLGVPAATHSTVAGITDALNVFSMLEGLDEDVPAAPFKTRVVGVPGSAVPFVVEEDFRNVESSDVVFIPSLLVSPHDWEPGSWPQAVAWLREMHARGAMLCSACSGALMLAETGLLDGGEATTHWAYADVFRRHFPQVPLRLERLLMHSGARKELIMSGASGSWIDLVLFLIAEHAGLAAAQLASKFLLLEWHLDGQLPYAVFTPRRDHGDAAVGAAQAWLDKNLSSDHPVENMIEQSGLPARTFNRRFMNATGLTPMRYLQRLRVEAAKHLLERSELAVEEVAWRIGYEEPAFFRRLFKRVTGIAPAAYRRKLQRPDYARR